MQLTDQEIKIIIQILNEVSIPVKEANQVLTIISKLEHRVLIGQEEPKKEIET